jgi:membrane glycosyltransferase
LKRLRLLLTPEETQPPPIVQRANALLAQNLRLRFDDADALDALHREPHLRERHEAMLPPAPPRRRGEIDPDRVIAQAKIVDAETITDATRWLKPKERMVVLQDRALIDMTVRLKAEASGG